MLVSEEAAEAKRKFWLPILSIASKEIIKHLEGRVNRLSYEYRANDD